MKILYDFQMFTMQRYGGISRYYYELSQEFKNDPEVEVTLGVQKSKNEYLLSDPDIGPRLVDNSFVEFNQFLVPGTFPGKGRLYKLYSKVFDSIYRRNKAYSKQLIDQGDFDIVHPTYYFLNDYYPGKVSVPVVITVYDLIHELMPEYFDLALDKTAPGLEQMVHVADKLIAISESTKEDLVRIYGVDPDKVEVVYLAASLSKEEADPDFEVDLPEKYLLFVGSRDRYKNFYFFARVAASLMKSDPDLHLVAAGGGKFNPGELEYLTELGILDRVQHVPGDDQSLIAAYSNATAFVHPSLYEGFGIPLLEAMNCDCPIVAAEASCLPEIAGEAALYFDPKGFESMRDALAAVLADAELRKELVEAGRQRRKDFSFAKTAQQTKAIYKQLLQNR